MAKSGELYFEVDARHLRQLGRELVANRVTALAELVKNAYDADATKVEVSFEGVDRAGGKLTVKDDGTGMTLEDVRRAWMRIATASKESLPVSPLYGRARAGQKGIGRFAVETLGKSLSLITKTPGSRTRTIVSFDWERAYRSGLDLTKVPNPFYSEPAEESEHGTTLVITDLEDPWNPLDIEEVQRSLLLLQPPFPIREVRGPSGRGHDPDPGFRVAVHRDGAAIETDYGIGNFLDASTAQITGSVASNGDAEWRLASSRYRITRVRRLEKKVLTTGPIRFKASYFIFLREAIGSIGVRQAQEMGDRFGGMRVYRDRLRVMPYGESENDWLELDAEYRRRGVLFPIGNINFFGYVAVSRDRNPLLIDTSSREGVLENEAFAELKTFVKAGLIWGAQEIASVRQRKLRAGGKARPALSRAELVARLSSLVKQLGGSGAAPAKALEAELRQLEAEAKRADQAQTTIQEELLGELALLRVLASLGASIAVFSHEVRSVLTAATQALGDVAEVLDELTETMRTRLHPKTARAQNALNRLSELAGYIERYVSQTRRRQKSALPLHDVISHFVAAFDATLNKRGIKVEWSVAPEHLRTLPMSRAEFEAVLFNLLTNAIKAMDDEQIRDKRLRITAREDGRTVVLRFEDSGVGIDPSIRARMFDAFVTGATPGESELGFGTGLGLKIVSDIVEEHGGKASAVEASPGYATCIELRLPAWLRGSD